jgi:hypothetical protein
MAYYLVLPGIRDNVEILVLRSSNDRAWPAPQCSGGAPEFVCGSVSFAL